MTRRTVMQMWQEAMERIEAVAPEEFAAGELGDDEVLLLDVREPLERGSQDTIPGARHVPRGILEWWACPSSPFFRDDGPFGDFDQRVVTFCAAGGNGAFSAARLKELGYRDVATIDGGFMAWSEAGLPTEPVAD